MKKIILGLAIVLGLLAIDVAAEEQTVPVNEAQELMLLAYEQGVADGSNEMLRNVLLHCKNKGFFVVEGDNGELIVTCSLAVLDNEA